MHIALPSRQGPDGMTGGIPGDDAPCDLHDVIFFLRCCSAALGKPLILDECDESCERGGIAAFRKEDGEEV